MEWSRNANLNNTNKLDFHAVKKYKIIPDLFEASMGGGPPSFSSGSKYEIPAICQQNTHSTYAGSLVQKLVILYACVGKVSHI